MQQKTICQGCWEQMHVPIPIRGPFSYLFKAVGIKKSQMHPNLCTICESMFTKVKKHKQIEVATTILFADLRGYTHLSQSIDPSVMNEVLNDFYDCASNAVWENEGIVNKFIGDAVLAIFNFPLVRKDHVQNAVKAAMQLQEQCRDIKTRVGLNADHTLGVGVGIHTGTCNIGEVGNSYKDFTAIGSTVNLASRLQGAALSGEILITGDVYTCVKNEFPSLKSKKLQLKGIDDPVTGYVIDKVLF
ncbi:MAG: adenylate/guanylate cyclase domain-containing protein [Ferruginibacter sp.]